MFFGKNDNLMQLTPIRNDDIIDFVTEIGLLWICFKYKVSLNWLLSDTF